ncbi:MAG: 50S ribosomal protein L11 methyltransferase [Bacillota bacterium]
MKWQQITMTTEKTAVEAVADIFQEIGSGGVVIEDPAMVRARIAANAWDAYEFTDEFLNLDGVLVRAYLPVNDQLLPRIAELRDRINALNRELPDSVREVDFTEVAEEDWANSWKKYYKPVRVGRRIVVKPTWEEYAAVPEDLVIELDPGMAFGTGTHPTTTMCLEALEGYVQGGELVYDVGTGSGILALAAAKLGAGRVLAMDIDDVAVKAAAQNAAANGVAGLVTVRRNNLLEGLTEPAGIVIANIVADIILKICPDAARVTKKGGLFIASGIIAPRAEEVAAELAARGFRLLDKREEKDWVLFAAVKEG